MSSITDGLSRDERQQLDARLVWYYECPLERNHSILTEDDCWGCATIRVCVVMAEHGATEGVMDEVNQLRELFRKDD